MLLKCVLHQVNQHDYTVYETFDNGNTKFKTNKAMHSLNELNTTVFLSIAKTSFSILYNKE